MTTSSAPLSLVTGSASGIGLAIGHALRAGGHRVLGLDLAEEPDGSPFESSYRCDVTSTAAVGDVAAEVAGTYGAVTSLVHCAGWSPHGDFLDSTAEADERVIAVNYAGLLNVARAFVPAMVDAHDGRVVVVASDAARIGVRGEAVYAGAKAAQIAFAKSLAVEVSRRGVTVNVVSPGTTDTPLLRQMLTDDQIEKRRRANPMRRLGEPADVAAAVEFFTRPDTAYITGQVLSVNGGMTRVD
ncbi:MAG: SDR family oxidoreductase [Streptosporangiales bacterium]|nr:SDR family oxidoreductase [Streptosporangiales bacterium]